MRKKHQIILALLTFCLILNLSGCIQDKKLAYSDSYIQFYFTSGQPTFSQPGEQVMIGYFLQPIDAKIHWSTDDESIATVDEHGIVTAMGPGSCNVTATVGAVTENGQVWDSYTTSTIEVTCDFD